MTCAAIAVQTSPKKSPPRSNTFAHTNAFCESKRIAMLFKASLPKRKGEQTRVVHVFRFGQGVVKLVCRSRTRSRTAFESFPKVFLRVWRVSVGLPARTEQRRCTLLSSLSLVLDKKTRDAHMAAVVIDNLLDFSQKLDIALLDRVVSSLYSGAKQEASSQRRTRDE